MWQIYRSLRGTNRMCVELIAHNLAMWVLIVLTENWNSSDRGNRIQKLLLLNCDQSLSSHLRHYAACPSDNGNRLLFVLCECAWMPFHDALQLESFPLLRGGQTDAGFCKINSYRHETSERTNETVNHGSALCINISVKGNEMKICGENILSEGTRQEQCTQNQSTSIGKGKRIVINLILPSDVIHTISRYKDQVDDFKSQHSVIVLSEMDEKRRIEMLLLPFRADWKKQTVDEWLCDCVILNVKNFPVQFQNPKQFLHLFG